MYPGMGIGIRNMVRGGAKPNNGQPPPSWGVLAPAPVGFSYTPKKGGSRRRRRGGGLQGKSTGIASLGKSMYDGAKSGYKKGGSRRRRRGGGLYGSAKGAVGTTGNVYNGLKRGAKPQ
jgi:hypothetical protein